MTFTCVSCGESLPPFSIAAAPCRPRGLAVHIEHPAA
jgi:hypothetical protein